MSELRETPDHENGIGRSDVLLKLSGGVMVGTPDSEIVAGVLRSIKEHEMPHTIYNATEMRAKFPNFHLADDEIAVWEDNAGFLMAELCVETYIAMAVKYGAEVHFEEPMLDWKPVSLGRSYNSDDGDKDAQPEVQQEVQGVEVRTSQGVYRAKKLVLSVGAWAPSLYGQDIPQVPLFIERRVLFWFECDQDKIQEFNVRNVFLWSDIVWFCFVTSLLLVQYILYMLAGFAAYVFI